MERTRTDEWRRAIVPTLRAGALASVGSLPLASLAYGLGLLDVDLASVLGTLVTADAARARRIGRVLNYANATAFAFLYAAAYRRLGRRPRVATGAALGVAHVGLALATLAVLARVHPRRASAHLGSVRSAAPLMVLGHVLYGAELGKLLQPAFR